MAKDSPPPPRRPDSDDPSHRNVPSGSIRHVVLVDGERVVAGDAAEIVARIAGRGRLLWPGGTPADRPCSTLYLPPRGSLVAHGAVRALRVVLHELRVARPAGPVAELLVGLVCQRAWHGPEPVTEAALTLVRHLIETETRRAAEARGTIGRRPNGPA